MGIFSRFRSNNQEKPPKSTVLFPLYIYPETSTTWQPLLDAIDNHPALDFIVVVNPNSGPGEPPWWPNPDYLREIPKLNLRPNVTTVGYVRVGYCNRDSSDVWRDVRQYAKWPRETGVKHLYVEGIFFDETPNEYSQFKSTYLRSIAQEVRSADGILGDKLVITNPGTMPHNDFLKKCSDITVVFEQSHQRLESLSQHEREVLHSCDRAKISYIVHSVPASLTEDGAPRIKQVTEDARCRAQFVFVTGRTSGYYEQFDASFREFIAAMAAD